MRIHPVLVLGLLAGLGLADRLPAAHAERTASTWKCFDTNKFPDPAEALEWGVGQKIAEGLNNVAPHIAPGTILQVTPFSNAQALICVN